METLLLEWLNLLLRWLHLITGIAWIGASFYFVWLDNSLETPPTWKKDKGVCGDLWAFHGGGIYEVAKYSLAPEKMPNTMHWFKWEAYSTWITGSLLLIVFYYVQADLYLVGNSIWIDTPAKAIIASVVFLMTGLLAYELALRIGIAQIPRYFICFMLGLIGLASWTAVNIFSDRAAFLHVGAMLASIMAANVFLGIIPAQKQFMRAIATGNTPEKASMLFAKMRSVHNNYLTLPVLFCMISNHYPFLYSHQYNWLILIVIIATTVYARHFFNLKHRGIVKPGILLTALFVLLVLIATMAYQKTYKQNLNVSTSPTKNTTTSGSANNKRLSELVSVHCTVCHAQRPTQTGFNAAPAGMMLENLDQIITAKQKIANVVQSQYMPLANITNMSSQERKELVTLLESI